MTPPPGKKKTQYQIITWYEAIVIPWKHGSCEIWKSHTTSKAVKLIFLLKSFETRSKLLVVLSHLCQKLVCWLISYVIKRKCRWKLRIVERPLDIFSASANCPLDTNFTFRTLRTGALECNWHTLSIICHPTSHSAVAFISPVWHSDTDFTFRTLPRDIFSAVAFRSLLWQKLHIILPNNSTHSGF